MPRAYSRSAPTWSAYPCSATFTRCTGISALRWVLSWISSTGAGRPAAHSSPNESEIDSATSTSCDWIADSMLSGGGVALIPWLARKATRLGAFSAPRTGTSSSLSSCVRARFSAIAPMPSMIAGYSSGPISRVRASVRRSRAKSRSSLRATDHRVAKVPGARRRFVGLLMRAVPRRCRSHARMRPPGSVVRTAHAARRRCRQRPPGPWR